MSAILNRWRCRIFILTFAVCLFPRLSLAAEGLDSGDTAWVIVSSTLVLMMTLPGLLLFYAGLVRSVNVISTSIHCYAIACLASVLWFAVGYSLAFGDGGQANAWIGGLEKAFLAGVGADALVGTIPESVFFTFQMTFIIITLGLIAGAYAERIKFAHVMLFSGLWGILVYAPVTHWIWGGGFLATRGVLDFAGGLVVHTTAGVSAIVIALMLGKRLRFPDKLTPPHNPILTVIGASLLWVGWSGFNAGSALAANGNAGLALVATLNGRRRFSRVDGSGVVPLRQAQSNRNGNRHHSGTRHGDAGSGLRSACRGPCLRDTGRYPLLLCDPVCPGPIISGRFPGCICRPRRGRNTRHAPGGGAGRRDVWRIGPRKRHRFSVYLSSDGSCGGGRMVGAGNLVDRSPDACDGRTQGQ